MASPKCPVCGASVRADNLSKHLQSVHPREAKPDMILEAERKATTAVQRPPPIRLRSSVPRWVPVVVIIMLLGIAGAYVVSTTPASPYTSSTPADQMCIEHTQIPGKDGRHDHAHLSIVILGVPYTIPSDVGRPPRTSCMRPLHVHEQEPGRIHVESPIAHEFTLGDFFVVWGQPFSDQQILNKNADATYHIVMTVDAIQTSAYQYYAFPHSAGEPQIIISYEARR